MVIPSYPRRRQSLINSLKFILNDPPRSLSEIIINWVSNISMIEEIIHQFSYQAQQKNISLRYSIFNDSTVNRRFLDAGNIKTDAFLSLDDDIRINPENLQYSFHVWQKHQNQLVGFPCRCISKKKFFLKKSLVYSCNEPDSKRLILTTIAFMSRELIAAYYSINNKQNVDFVRKLNNCEDILMNFVAMNVSNRPSILIQRKYSHLISSNGISNKHNHQKIRSICLNTFYKSFHKLPLPITEKWIFNY